ncbi:MAG: oxidoreductase [Sphingomonadales bacterium 35-56-22]|jgi:3-hydroxyisobutyrate dehydrogenase|uniref:NAD(P)-dependent oxidoreductase n=1 Tax=Sphingorhabdus sp. TaxID=1902408 RepID=UPI000BD2AD86|nr:NAD(P)-dependent oxidoreductase [Sphingorhabdus sp.]OYY16753.1 MAG: oxidoreductase [Sphingomonadales bacterium 35-56-22]OYY98913.1 MAG: oxidoreductase [Sphingomonadales bacterium 28-56-43]OYZ60382.1 MAG: oxidoreductase [Sphingomonadales bacterium 24-56-14]OZA83265.1 MAG: oxidoreductase [Sphingomonadales bacterium 39-57-19]HQS12170.1 NAD(P)-dependent oxidoreductase [Sphingorhabdus sp.]
MTRIAFIGLGVMGGPMARHLKQAGHDLTVYNRSRAKAENWVATYGGTLALSPADAAKDAEVVISCVGTDDDLAGVTLGRDGAFAAMAKGSLYIDHTTVSARIARQLGVEAKSRGLLVVDAPVTGGQAGAENGTLSIMCGGSEAAVEAARPIMAPYAKRVVHVGGPGTGQITKMCNQIAFAGIIQSLSEAMRFAQSAELDVEKVYEAISGGAAQSWQMDNRWATMAEDKFDFGFAVDWMRKDLGLAFEEARAVGATLPITAIIDQFYADVQHMGGGRLDTSAIVKRLPKG